ncbi:hypothetical protein NE237_026722 [Protea cynaroides]|uniref:Uncharacterized protein n=1 Tax=Protea cynaroides TaxID=273540 RepID=A0A9Q0GPK2_9MAGN|nr:hypothetical protein NE237_026722 [Protea cynaroides]
MGRWEKILKYEAFVKWDVGKGEREKVSFGKIREERERAERRISGEKGRKPKEDLESDQIGRDGSKRGFGREGEQLKEPAKHETQGKLRLFPFGRFCHRFKRENCI